jgi:glycosyltransferase involved in cell wall biosynthesis
MLATPTAALDTLRPCPLRALPHKPLVSVLVGNYNYADYLGQSIESVLHQSYDNWELIICDDGSTDHSVRVIQQYLDRDARIRLVCKQNGGHPSALNAAYAESRGELICLLDSDDLYLPEKLARVVEAAAASPDAGFIVHRVIRVNQQRRRHGVWPLSELPNGWHGPELLHSGGILPYLPPTSGLALRREIAELLFPLRTEPPFRMSPDQIIMRLAPLVTHVRAVPQALAEYRLHNANTYAQRRVTADSVKKELGLTRALWKEQYRFLSSFSPQLADHLASLDHNVDVAFATYLAARLDRDSRARLYHDDYIRVCQEQERPKWYLLWRMSLYFPLPVFRLVANFVLGPSLVKQLVARFKGLA